MTYQNQQHISITSTSVGSCFGTIGVLKVGERRVESDVVGHGCGSAAKQQAYEAAVRAGLIVELGELTTAPTDAIRSAAEAVGAQILLDRYVAVWGGHPQPEFAAREFERILSR